MLSQLAQLHAQQGIVGGINQEVGVSSLPLGDVGRVYLLLVAVAGGGHRVGALGVVGRAGQQGQQGQRAGQTSEYDGEHGSKQELEA